MNKIEHLNSYTESLEKHIRAQYTDGNIARGIFDFINGYTNYLPKPSILCKLIKSIKSDNKISMYQGVTVYLVDNNEKEYYEIVVDIETPVDEKRTRIDRISIDKHVCKYLVGTQWFDIKDREKKKSKFKDFPEIEDKRIRYIQHYLEKIGNIEYKKEKVNKRTK